MYRRMAWVDYAKGIGIILVVYGHVLRGVYSADINVSYQYYILSDKIVYGFHMPLFFFLSGLFAEKFVNKTLIEGFKQKIKTLLLPYLIWSVFQITVMVILSNYTNTNTSWKVLLDVPINPYAQFWFVYILFFLFTVYYFLRKLLEINSLLILSLIFYFLTPLINFWIFDGLTFYLIFFVLGVFITKSQFSIKNIYLIVLFPLIIFINYLYLYSDFHSALIPIIQLLVAISGILLIVKLANLFATNDSFPFLRFLGTVSMPIYLIHILAGSGFRIILTKFLHYDNVLFHIVGGTIIGLVLPVIFYKITMYLHINYYLFGDKRKGNKTYNLFGIKSKAHLSR